MDEQLWRSLLSLSQGIARFADPIHYCCVDRFDPYHVLINQLPNTNPQQPVSQPDRYIYIDLKGELTLDDNLTLLEAKSISRLIVKQVGQLSLNELSFLQHYLPYCFLPIYARKSKRAISIAHFAQSLDGRIATNSGDSRWIGCDENLIHAHRMRALCNGILVGSNTVAADQPKLTVRRVEGKNPIRVVLGSSKQDYTSLFESCDEPVLLLSSAEIKTNGRVHTFRLESNNGKIKSSKILELLYRQGIYSVYIEGGAITTSNFINDRAVDILQLHFSPLLFGSGKNGVVLPEISEVRKAVQFDDFHFQPIGNSMMFVGQITSV